jgi:hypothetical protein
MVVMPAFPEGYQGQERFVAAFVAGTESLAPPEVIQGVDGAGGMKQHRGGEEETPDQHLGTGGSQGRGLQFQNRSGPRPGSPRITMPR